jgi:Xaa-Pro aminopeptidase
VVTSGPRSALADAFATDRALALGELLRFDIGCLLDGYWSDIGRTAVVGPPDELQRRRYDAIFAGEQTQIDSVKPGMAAGEVFDLAMDEVRAHGIPGYRRQHCGHGIGAEVYENPIITAGVATPLEVGMTFCFETPYYELGWGGMMVEDTLVITETGCTLLTESDRSLRVIEA